MVGILTAMCLFLPFDALLASSKQARVQWGTPNHKTIVYCNNIKSLEKLHADMTPV